MAPLLNRLRKFFMCASIPMVLLAHRAHAASSSDTGTLNKTIILTLQPVVDLFSGRPWLQGISAIVVTFTVASLVTWVLFKLIRKATNYTSMQLDDQIATILRTPVYYTLLVTGISNGLSLLPLSTTIYEMATKSVHTIGVIVWVLFASRLASLLLSRVVHHSDKFSFIQRRTLTLFDNVAKVAIFSVGLYVVFVIWKIDMTAWLASAGVVGIAVGFAAKDTLSNLFSGVFILADAPYKVGDYIVLEGGGRGKVTNIGLRSTRILTRDDVEVTIPNSIIGNTTIINQSGGPSKKLRLRVKVGVAYGSNVDQIRAILMNIAQHEQLVCGEPVPRVRFRTFGASSLDFELLCWISRPVLRGRTLDSLNDAIYKKFEKEGVEIPYNKQDLYIKGLPDQLSSVSAEPVSIAKE